MVHLKVAKEFLNINIWPAYHKKIDAKSVRKPAPLSVKVYLVLRLGRYKSVLFYYKLVGKNLSVI